MSNSIEERLQKLDQKGTYTKATGQYTTAEWSEGTNTCVWTAPKKGAYIIFMKFTPDSEEYAKIYKQFQMHGTADRPTGAGLMYQYGPCSLDGAELSKSIIEYQACTIAYASEAGKTVTPYIHSPVAGHVWNVQIVGVFIG